MYRISPFVRHFAWALLAGVAVATLWVNSDASGYYDFIEWRLVDLPLPVWMNPIPVSLTPLRLVSDGLMALFMAFIGKELWEALVLERGGLTGRRGLVPLGGVIGGLIGAATVWLLAEHFLETAIEAAPGMGWQVPLGSDVVLAYVFGRRVFGPQHPALHVLLLITIATDLIALLLAGLANPMAELRLLWLGLPMLASVGVWLFYGRRPDPRASESRRRRGLQLWPYCLAALVSFVGVAASGLPPALGFLPVIPAIPHAERAFGLFAEAEEFLHDPLNRLAHHLVKPLALVLFLFGLTRGGIDLLAWAPTSVSLLAALWIGKPLGLWVGLAVAARLMGPRIAANLSGLGLRDFLLIGLLSGMGFTVPVLAIESALPGGGMSEAARMALAISLLAGPFSMLAARLLPRR